MVFRLSSRSDLAWLLTVFRSNVFFWIVFPQLLIGFSILKDRENNLLDDVEHMWLDQLPRMCMSNAVDERTRVKSNAIYSIFLLSFRIDERNTHDVLM